MHLQRIALLAGAVEATLLLSPSVKAIVKPATSLDLAAAPILGCTTNSFSIPSWFVHNFTFAKADDSATFRLTNRANNYTANFGCANATASPVSTSLWAHCSVIDGGDDDESSPVLVRVNNGSTADILLSQTWSCNDRNQTQPIKFAASGTGSVSLNCTDSAGCEAVDSPLLIKGNLMSPVAITPAYANGPVGHATAGCSAAAKAPPSWTLQTVYYLNQTGDNGATALASQTVMLQVINHAIGYQAGCVGFLSDSLSTKPTAFNCTGQGYDFVGKDRYRIQTQALFEPATFRFSVNQTWYCDDEDASKPISITASGSMVLPLNCTSVPINSTTPGGSGNKTTCVSTGDIVLRGEHAGTVTPLAPYSITDPLPTPDGCTASSIVSPFWTLSSFEVDHSTNGTSNASTSDVGFNIKFRTGTNEFTYPVSVYQGKAVNATAASKSKTDQPQWHACTFGSGEAPLAPFDCSFAYDAAAKELTLNADWICSDLDKAHPILFSGTTTTKINKPLSCTTSGAQSQCLTDEDASWDAPIEKVTWRAADTTVLAPA